MKVEIWSDVACPFCYIGKRHFEKALASFPDDNIEVEWKSFELDPNAQKEYEDDLYTLLANKYRQTREWALESAASMKQKGKDVGLDFNFDKTISTNTFDAHRLIQLAKSKGKQDEAEEVLFKAYFTDGKHIGNPEVLQNIGNEIGLDANEVKQMLASNHYKKEVRADENLSQEFGIRGVPFFVINRKYGISGAQPVDHFKDTLSKALSEESTIIVEKGSTDACGIDGCA